MNNRAMTLAILIALFSVFLVSSWVSEVEEKAQKRYGTQVLVVKAKQDIRENENITEKMLTLEAIPKTFLEPNAINFVSRADDPDTQISMKSLANTVAIVPIKKGEQISYNKITEPGVRMGLASQVTPGRRAIAIKVEEDTAVSRLIKPGDRVDLLGVIDRGGGRENRISKTLLQDVVVLSVGKNVTNNIPRVLEFEGGKERIRSLTQDVSFSTITIEVDPVQAQAIVLIAGNAENKIIVSLRNNDDTERVNLGVTALPDVIDGDIKSRRGLAGQGQK